jgi:hypothetical protein
MFVTLRKLLVTIMGHRVIDITNGHFIHAGPLEGIGVSIYLVTILINIILGHNINNYGTKPCTLPHSM